MRSLGRPGWVSSPSLILFRISIIEQGREASHRHVVPTTKHEWSTSDFQSGASQAPLFSTRALRRPCGRRGMVQGCLPVDPVRGGQAAKATRGGGGDDDVTDDDVQGAWGCPYLRRIVKVQAHHLSHFCSISLASSTSVAYRSDVPRGGYGLAV
jgi:hypothetical protein